MLPATCSICLSIVRWQLNLIFHRTQAAPSVHIPKVSSCGLSGCNKVPTAKPHFEATALLQNAWLSGWAN
ncbi:hypothetical protein GCM10023307_04260 [Lysobacter hankyongensis]|uniref:Secreted protein n=1 Tax=Lysobacter hankyongensis TaxID=1176535 RepID=A0ABP9AKS9_9GAMM